MNNKEELIKIIVEAPEKLGRVPFTDIVKATSGYQVIPLDTHNQKDLKLLEKIKSAANDYLEITRRSKRRLRGDRINEVGKYIESEFLQELSRHDLEVEILGAAGYPDIKIIDPYGRITYLESKATSKGWNSTLRSFYYTSGRKIEYDARHLLIGWKVKEERDKYWEVLGCRLVDLSTVELELKSEFNAGNLNIYRTTLFELM